MSQTATERAQQRWRTAKQNRHGDDGGGALPPGGPGGTSDDMEARVKRLEDESKEIRADLKKLLVDVAEIKGRVASMPTTLQLVGFVLAIFVASGMLRWFGH